MKKLGTLALALALTGTMAAPALAAREMHPLISARPETPLISSNPNAAYSSKIVLNGTAMELPQLRDMGEGLIPLRAVAEADYGMADWYQEDGEAVFYMTDHTVSVTFATGAITVDDEAITSTAVLDAVNGVTFVPAQILADIEGYAVQTEGDTITITTPNNDPTIQLGYKVSNAADMAMGMRETVQGMIDMYQIPADQFESVFAVFPMMTTPDTIVVGKLAENADAEAIKAALEAYRQKQEDTFSWYLSYNLPKIENAKMIVENGWFLFLMAENADAGVETFRTLTASK